MYPIYLSKVIRNFWQVSTSLEHGILYKRKTNKDIFKFFFVHIRLMDLACGASLVEINVQIRTFVTNPPLPPHELCQQ